MRELALKYLGLILQRRNRPLDSSLLKGALIISMGTAYHLHHSKKPEEDGASMEIQALSFLFLLFDQVLGFVTTLSVELNQKKKEQTVAKVAGLLETSLPLVKLICDWLFANQAQWKSFQPAEVPILFFPVRERLLITPPFLYFRLKASHPFGTIFRNA